MISAYFRMYPDLVFSIRRCYEREELVVTEWTATATHARAIPTRRGLARPTGKVLTWCGVDVMPMSGGLIVRKDAYADSAALLRQLESGIAAS